MMDAPTRRELFIQLESDGGQQTADYRLSIRCPQCGRHGTFDRYTQGAPHDLVLGEHVLGHRRCPTRACNTHVFFIAAQNEVLACYPPDTIDFDPEGVPSAVRDAIEEAIVAHAHRCYRAAALMVRRAIEEICLDKKAEGATLYDRIEALGSLVVLPKPFLDGLHDLRLLGNDAAHVEARVYEDIGDDEIGAGIVIAKELIRAVYQYEAIMGQLTKLKAARGEDS